MEGEIARVAQGPQVQWIGERPRPRRRTRLLDNCPAFRILPGGWPRRQAGPHQAPDRLIGWLAGHKILFPPLGGQCSPPLPFWAGPAMRSDELREFLVQLELRFPGLRWGPEVLKTLSEMEGESAGADLDFHKVLRILAGLSPTDGAPRDDSLSQLSPHPPAAADATVARLEAELRRTREEAERSQLESRRLEQDLAQALRRINEVESPSLLPRPSLRP